MIKTLLTIPSQVYNRLARKRETRNVTAVVTLVNKPLKAAKPAASLEYSSAILSLKGKSTVKNNIEYRMDEIAIKRNNCEFRTKS